MGIKPIIATVLVAATLLTGCQTQNAYTGEQQASKSTTYGLGGLLAGAAIGAMVDGKDGAWKGALAGGAAGVGIGHYMDQQEAMLRQHLQNTGVQVEREGDSLKLIMPSNITFASSSADVKSSFYPVLGSITTVFKEFDQNLIEVVGYTDSTGSDRINLPLSNDRARSVAEYLVFQGVEPQRISYYGRGSLDPIASNKTAAGRAQNRRVEIKLHQPLK